MDLFDEAKVTPIPGTFVDRSSRPNGPMTQTLTDTKVGEEALSISMGHCDLSDVSPNIDQKSFLIEHETMTEIWTPKVKGGLANLRFRDQALREVGAATNSRLEHVDSSDVIIRGSNSQSIKSAVSKLHVVDTMAHSRSQFPHVSFIEISSC